MPGSVTRYIYYASIQRRYTYTPGSMTRYIYYVSIQTRYAFVLCRNLYTLGPVTQYAYSPGPVTQCSYASVLCRYRAPGPATQYIFYAYVQCQYCYIPGPATQYMSYVAVQCQYRYASGPVTQYPFVLCQYRYTPGPVTQYSFYMFVRCRYRYTPGPKAQNTFYMSVHCQYRLYISGPMTHYISVQSQYCYTSGPMIRYTSSAFVQSRYHCMLGPITCYTFDISVERYCHHMSAHRYKPENLAYKISCKWSAFPLILAINRSIYYLMNGTLNCSQDVDHLIKRILMALQRYITRRNDFKYYWFILLLSGLTKSQHISLWVFIVFFKRLVIAKKNIPVYKKNIY